MKRALIWLGWAGGIGLLLATAVDTAGVIGRHVGPVSYTHLRAHETLR